MPKEPSPEDPSAIEASRPVLIDTDPGIDDALALALAFNSPELDIITVTTVAGNAGIDAVTHNAALVLRLFDAPSTTKLVRGAGKPRRGPVRDAKDFHGTDGLGGWTSGQRKPLPTHPLAGTRAARAIVTAARTFGSALTIVALGPLTNIARAVDLDVDAMRSVGRIIAMGGAVRTAGNVTPLAEFNFHADPSAALVTLGAALPLILVPLDVTHQVRLPPAYLRDAMAGRSDARARAIRVMARHAYQRQPQGFALHDPLAVAIAIAPELVTTETIPVDVLEGPAKVAGATVEDRRPLPANDKTGAWTRTALAVDMEQTLALFAERVLADTKRPRAAQVAVLGGLNMDYVVTATTLPRAGETVAGDTLATFAGGKGANQAVAASRAGARVTQIGRVGDDPDGAALKQALAADQVRLVPPGTARQRTGAALINVDAKGHNQISVAPGANREINRRHVQACVADIRSARVLLCQFETPLPALLAALGIARRCGTYTVVNPSPVRALDKALPALTNLLIVNETEAQAFTGLPVTSRKAARSALARLHILGFEAAVITLGAKGAVWSNGVQHGFQPATPVRATDTTGAGDTFTGYTAAALARGADLAIALEEASSAAALSVQKPGAQASIPTAARVRRALRQR